MITTILFDVDGVLIDSFEANFEFFRRLFAKAGYTPPTKHAYKNMFQLTMLDVICTVTQSTDQQEIQRLMNIGKQRSTIYPYDLIKTPPTLYEVIKKLHNEYTLGLVTSRIKSGVFEMPQLAPVKEYFSVVVSFEDTVHHKPHPDPLLFGVQQLGVQPSEVIYIGDQEADLLASKAAGTKSIMISNQFFPDADACVEKFEDIPNAISKVA